MPETREIPIANKDIQKIRSKEHHGLYASGGPLYKDAIFGRDSIESAEDILDIKPDLAEEVILTMARFQGKAANETTEEEPGRIHHEHRSLNIKGEGTEISIQSKEILKKLSAKWGGTEQEMTYYGSVDATPLYVRLVADYCKKFNDSILDKEVIHHNGEKITIRQSFLEAVKWLENRLEASDLGLLEYKRTNPAGHANPVWKDSSTAYIHENGELANHAQPIASIEVQGLAYDALRKSSDLLRKDPEFAQDVARWEDRADKLKQATLKNFWMEDRQYFSMGIDRDPKTGQPRKIETISSDPAALLDTTIFDDLPENLKQKYISGILKTVYSPQLMTDAGVRCRALEYVNIVDFADYHGTWAVWIKETYDIAKGLKKQGFPKLAEQLEIRILNSVNIAGVNYEFFYVDPQGRVNYNPNEEKLSDQISETILGSHIPEGLQAWTISAVLAIKHRRGQRTKEETAQNDWQKTLEQQLLNESRVPVLKILTSEDQIKSAFPTGVAFTINKQEAKRREMRYKSLIK